MNSTAIVVAIVVIVVVVVVIVLNAPHCETEKVRTYARSPDVQRVIAVTQNGQDKPDPPVITKEPTLSTDSTIPLSTDHNAEALLLTCLDYRFLERIAIFMDSIGLRDSYDHFVLAGAELGLAPQVNPMIPMWQRTWWDHLDLAMNLHHIKRVIILSHEDCGGYREFTGFTNTLQDVANPTVIPPAEVDIHTKYLHEAYYRIKARYPQLQVDLYMIGLVQDVIQIPPPPPIQV